MQEISIKSELFFLETFADSVDLPCTILSWAEIQGSELGSSYNYKFWPWESEKTLYSLSSVPVLVKGNS